MGNHTIDMFAGLQAAAIAMCILSGVAAFIFSLCAIDRDETIQYRNGINAAIACFICVFALFVALSIK